MSYVLNKIIMIPMVLIALTVHEYAHGLVSTKLGDPTPRMSGRMTLNPLAHLDPVGTLLMILTGFGWAKPVGINPRYYKNPKNGMAITALAGPVSNFLLAVVAMLIYGIIFIVNVKTGFFDNSMPVIAMVIVRFAQLNLCFMVFNFIPIPPLDGSRIIGLVLSDSAYFKLQQYERYSFAAIILLSALGVFDRVIGTGVDFIFTGILTGLERLVMVIL